MEFLIVASVIAVLLLFATGKGLWVWLAVLVGASAVGFQAYRLRCAQCRRKVISGLGMKFCNQCGVEQKARRWFRLRCENCRQLARSELNLNYCNLCGHPVTERSR